MAEENTSFSKVFDAFFSKITDDMYMELFPEETEEMVETLLINAIPSFEFPRVDLFDYTLSPSGSVFNNVLTQEEINIIATYMVVEWMGYQLASVENVRMKYSGSDFKFTSQAAHMRQILETRNAYKSEGLHLQRLYKRRIRSSETGLMQSTLNKIMEAN